MVLNFIKSLFSRIAAALAVATPSVIHAPEAVLAPGTAPAGVGLVSSSAPVSTAPVNDPFPDKLPPPHVRVIIFSSTGPDSCESTLHQALEPIAPQIEDAMKMLSVDVPIIKMVPYIVDNNSHPMTGFYDIKDNLILLGYYDCKTRKTRTYKEMLETILHELRHAWQYKYKRSEYYNHNAIGLEAIDDPAEIDADAFIMAYMEGRMKYKGEYSGVLRAYIDNDKGARKTKKAELISEYFSE